MSTYIPNIPQAGDFLDESQPQILGNFQSADASFGKDHYGFSNLTTNNGLHNIVTQPTYVEVPPTGLPPTTTSLLNRIYAFKINNNLDLLQFSRGPNNAVPTPLTSLQSSSAPISINSNSTVDIFDFATLTNVLCRCVLMNNDATYRIQEALVSYSAAAGVRITVIDTTPTFNNLVFVTSGTKLSIKNTLGSGSFTAVSWTIQFLRIL